MFLAYFFALRKLFLFPFQIVRNTEKKLFVSRLFFIVSTIHCCGLPAVLLLFHIHFYVQFLGKFASPFFHSLYPLSLFSQKYALSTSSSPIFNPKSEDPAFEDSDNVAHFAVVRAQPTNSGFRPLVIQPSSDSVRRLLHGLTLTSITYVHKMVIHIGSISSKYDHIPYSYSGLDDASAFLGDLTFDFHLWDSCKTVHVSRFRAAALSKCHVDANTPVVDVSVSRAFEGDGQSRVLNWSKTYLNTPQVSQMAHQPKALNPPHQFPRRPALIMLAWPLLRPMVMLPMEPLVQFINSVVIALPPSELRRNGTRSQKCRPSSVW